MRTDKWVGRGRPTLPIPDLWLSPAVHVSVYQGVQLRDAEELGIGT